MKPVWGLILVICTATGCAGMDTAQSVQASGTSNAAESNQRSKGLVTQPTASFDSAPAFPPNIGPQPVLPVTGGTPVIGIPLGGSIYLPVTGGPPIVGIPLAP